MTDQIPNDVPDVVTIACDGVTIATEVFNRGDVLKVDLPTYRATLDRNGDSPLALTERQQVERYRRVLWHSGDCSDHIRTTDAEAEARAAAEKAAQPDTQALEAARDIWAEEDERRASRCGARAQGRDRPFVGDPAREGSAWRSRVGEEGPTPPRRGLRSRRPPSVHLPQSRDPRRGGLCPTP